MSRTTYEKIEENMVAVKIRDTAGAGVHGLSYLCDSRKTTTAMLNLRAIDKCAIHRCHTTISIHVRPSQTQVPHFVVFSAGVLFANAGRCPTPPPGHPSSRG